MSDERAANNRALRHSQTGKTLLMIRKFELGFPLSPNPSSHNSDQRYKNGGDLSRDKGKKKGGEGREASGARCGISLLSSFRLFRSTVVGCHNEKVKFMEFLLSTPPFFTPGSSLAVLAASKPDIFPAAPPYLTDFIFYDKNPISLPPFF